MTVVSGLLSFGMVMAKSKNYIIDMKTGFYNRRFFNLRLREERLRTERSGSPFSVLTLNISGLANLIQKQPKLKIHQMKKVLTTVFRENTRDIDIKNWHDDTTLKILMPETPKSGAATLAEKLQEKIDDAFKTFFGLMGALDLKKHMKITSYPEIMEDSAKSKSKRPEAKKSMASPPIRWGNKRVSRSPNGITGRSR
jgi:GGDEF domain-containing protein